jgi:Skp family chaperone for outer membrane proteins
MSRKQIVIAALLAVAVIAGGVGAYFYFGESDENPAPAGETAAPEAKGPVPDPVLLVVDKAAIVQTSKAGQDIGRQVQAYAQAARAQLDPQARALRADEAALKAQLGSLSVEERQRRVTALEAKERAFQQQAAQKDALVKQAVAQAQKQLSAKMGPILKQIMDERHANMILDKQAVMFGLDSSLDVSAEAVKRLDAAMPSLQVQLPKQ